MCAGLCHSAEVTDDFGRSVTLARPARRIICLYGAFNEILLALGAKNQITARTAADKDVPELAHLPAIGTHMRPNAELILAAKPDVVIQLAGRAEADLQTTQLRQLGVKTLSFRLNSFNDLFNVTLKLGQITGHEQAARDLVRDWRERLEKIKKPACRPLIYYEIREPLLLAAGKGGIVNDIIEAAGGVNAVAKPEKLVRYNEEALLLANPDFCITQKGPMNQAPREISERPNLASVKCSKPGRNIVVSERLFARPGPLSVKAAEDLAAILDNSGICAKKAD